MGWAVVRGAVTEEEVMAAVAATAAKGMVVAVREAASMVVEATVEAVTVTVVEVKAAAAVAAATVVVASVVVASEVVA